MDWGYIIIGAVLYLAVKFISKRIKSDTVEVEVDDLVNYECPACKDGLESHYNEQICPQCGRQLDPTMNS